MSLEENKALFQRWFEEVVNANDYSKVEELLAPHYRAHFPGAPEAIDRDGHRGMVEFFAAAFPDWEEQIQDVIAEGDRVVLRVTAGGTHEGEFQGIAPTGETVTHHRHGHRPRRERADRRVVVGVRRDRAHDPAGRDPGAGGVTERSPAMSTTNGTAVDLSARCRTGSTSPTRCTSTRRRSTRSTSRVSAASSPMTSGPSTATSTRSRAATPSSSGSAAPRRRSSGSTTCSASTTSTSTATPRARSPTSRPTRSSRTSPTSPRRWSRAITTSCAARPDGWKLTPARGGVPVGRVAHRGRRVDVGPRRPQERLAQPRDLTRRRESCPCCPGSTRTST